MSTVVLTLTIPEIEQLREANSFAIVKVPAHTHYQMKFANFSLTAYTSGKAVFQGDELSIEAFLEQNGLTGIPQKSAPTTKKKAAPESTLPHGFANWSVIGSDEVGTGSYFGPLTVAAAYVPQDKIAALKELGVRDSKNLTDTQIRMIVPKIKELIPYKLLTVSPEKYNDTHKTKNMNEIKALLHNQVLKTMLETIAPEHPQAILIDEFAPASTYYRYLKGETIADKDLTYFQTKGESHHIAVAAASMIARDGFLAGLEQLSQLSGYDIPSGADDNVDRIAARILKLEGEEALYRLAKMHFANTEKVRKLANE